MASYRGIKRSAKAAPLFAINVGPGKGRALVEYAEWEQVVPESGRPERPLVMAFCGLGFGRLRLDELEGRFPDHKVDYLFVSAVGTKDRKRAGLKKWGLPRLGRYPSPVAIGRTDAFYLAGIPAGTLGSALTGLIERRVRRGARLVVLGGPQAFGNGGYAGSPLEELLPVKSDGLWSIANVEEAAPIVPTAEAPAALRSLDWAAGPLLRYRHPVQVKEDAGVLLTGGGLPALARANRGKGEVYAFVGLPYGSGEGAFWTWEDWPALLALLPKADE